MQVGVAGAAVGEAVDEPGVAVVGEDDRPVRGEQAVVLEVAHAVRVFVVRHETGDVDDVDDPDGDLGQVAAQQLGGGQYLLGKMEDLGVKVLLGRTTTAILGNGHVEGVALSDDSVLEADVVVVAAGIRPNVELAVKAGLAGIAVIAGHTIAADAQAMIAVADRAGLFVQGLSA